MKIENVGRATDLVKKLGELNRSLDLVRSNKPESVTYEALPVRFYDGFNATRIDDGLAFVINDVVCQFLLGEIATVSNELAGLGVEVQ